MRAKFAHKHIKKKGNNLIFIRPANENKETRRFQWYRPDEARSSKFKGEINPRHEGWKFMDKTIFHNFSPLDNIPTYLLNVEKTWALKQ